MNRDGKIYLIVIVFVGATYLASVSLDIAVLNDLFIVSVLLGGIGLVGKFIKDTKIAERINTYNQGSGSGIQYSTNECKEIATEWAKTNFKGRIKSKKGLSFDWTQSSTDPAPVYDFPSDDWIHIRYFYTPYGPKNKGVYVFVDATNGEHYATKPVKKHEMKDNPFNYLESYKMTQRNQRLINSYNGREQNQQFVGVSGIPVQNPQGNQEESE